MIMSQSKNNLELPDDTYRRVVALSERANIAFDRDDPESAIEPLNEALEMLPTPQRQWEATTIQTVGGL